MHFFIAWKTEKNKIHFSEHVHEPAIIFFVYVQMLYFVKLQLYIVHTMYVSLPSNYRVCYQYVQICFISCMAIFGMTFFHFKVIFRSFNIVSDRGCKTLYWEGPPWDPSSYSFICLFGQKRYPFGIPFIDKWYLS